jgi:hypothetical protein
MISSESGQKLQDLGMLSKEQLDALYMQTSGEQAAEVDSEKDSIAQRIAQAIGQNPDVADVAQRVQGFAALPPPAPVPIPNNTTPLAAPVASEMPGAPVSTASSPTPLPEDQRVMANAAVDSAASAMAETGNTRTALDHLQTGISMQKAAILQGAQATQAHAAQTSAIYAGAANQLQKVAADAEAKQAMLDAKRDEQLAKQTAAVDSFNTEKIDPNHFWGSRSTTQKIAASIGMIFSAAGGGSKAYDVINKSIQDDLDVQKANLDLKLRGLDVRSNLLSQMHTITGDYNTARNLAEATQINQAKLMVERASSLASGAKSQAEVMDALGKLDVAYADSMQKAAKSAGFQVNQTSADAAGGVPVLPANFNPAQLDKEDRKLFIPGLGIAANDVAYKKATDGKAAFDQLMTTLNKLRDLRSNPDTGVGVESSNSQARVKANSLRNDALLITKAMANLGALDVGVDQFFDGTVQKDPLGPIGEGIFGMKDLPLNLGTRAGNIIYGDRLLAQLDTFEESARQQYVNNLKNFIVIRSPETQRFLNLQSELTGGDKSALPKAPGSK